MTKSAKSSSAKHQPARSRRRVLPHAWKSLAVHGCVILALVYVTREQSQSIRQSQEREYADIQEKLAEAEKNAKTAEGELLRQMLEDELMEPFQDLVDGADLDIEDADAILADLRNEVAQDVAEFLAGTQAQAFAPEQLEAFKAQARLDALAAVQRVVSDHTRDAVIAEVTDYVRNDVAQRLQDGMENELKSQVGRDLAKLVQEDQTKQLTERLADARGKLSSAIKDLENLKKNQDNLRKNLHKDVAKKGEALAAQAKRYQDQLAATAAAVQAATETGLVDSAALTADATAHRQATEKALADTTTAVNKKDGEAAQSAADATAQALAAQIADLKAAQGTLDQAIKKRTLSADDQAYAKAVVEKLENRLSAATEKAVAEKAAPVMAKKVAEEAKKQLDQLGLDGASVADAVNAAAHAALADALTGSGAAMTDETMLGLRDQAGALDVAAMKKAQDALTTAADSMRDLAAKQKKAAATAPNTPTAPTAPTADQATAQRELAKDIAASQRATQAALDAAKASTPGADKPADEAAKALATANPAAKASQAARDLDNGSAEQAKAAMTAAEEGLTAQAKDLDALAAQVGKAAKAATDAAASTVSAASDAASAAADTTSAAIVAAAAAKIAASAEKAASKTNVGSAMDGDGSVRTAKLGNLADKVAAIAARAAEGRDATANAAPTATGDLATTAPEASESATASTPAPSSSGATPSSEAPAASTPSPADIAQLAAAAAEGDANAQAALDAMATAAASTDAAANTDATATASTGAAASTDAAASASAAAAPASATGSPSATPASAVSAAGPSTPGTPGAATASASAAAAAASSASAAPSVPGGTPGAAPAAAPSAPAHDGGEGGGVAYGHGYNTYATYNRALYEQMRATQSERESQGPVNSGAENATAGATNLQVTNADANLARLAKPSMVFVPTLSKATEESSTDGVDRSAPAPAFSSLGYSAADLQSTTLTIDGDVSDWGELRHPMTMRFLKEGGTPAEPVRLYMRWSPGGLYFCYFVPNRSEAQVRAEPVDAKPYEGDLLELYIDPDNLRKENMRVAPNTQQLLFIPFGWRDPKLTIVEVGRGYRGIQTHSYRAYSQGDMGMTAAQFTDGGYWVEAALSTHALASPNLRAGMWMAANFSINRGYDYAVQQQWSAPKDAETFNKPDTWGDILLLGSDAKAEIITDEVGTTETRGQLISPGESVKVRVTDKDMNFSSAVRDRLLAEVRIRGTNASMYVVLEETEDNSGVFEASFNTQQRFLPARENTIGVTGGETLELFYADKRAAFGEKTRTCLAEIRVALPVFSLE